MDYCAECGEPLMPQPNGSRLRCCHGWGYWSSVPPMAGYKLPKRGMLWLYLNLEKWPKGKKATKPNNGGGDGQ